MRSQFLAPLATFLAMWGIMFSLKDNWGPIQTPLYESAHRVNNLFNPIASIVSGAILSGVRSLYTLFTAPPHTHQCHSTLVSVSIIVN